MTPTYRITTAAVIHDPKKGFLLGKRSLEEDTVAGFWSLIAGKLEATGPAQDVLEDNLRKEIKEEIGVLVDNINYLDSHMWQDTDPLKITIVFTVTISAGEPKALDPREITDINWFKPDEINNLKLPPHVHHVLEKAQKQLC